MKPKTPGFQTLLNKGVHITFENGCTVSVQWGYGNYCNNWNVGDYSSYDPAKGQVAAPHCANAEIAAWDAEGDWIRPDYEEWHDDVCGHQTPAQVLRFINYVASR